MPTRSQRIGLLVCTLLFVLFSAVNVVAMHKKASTSCLPLFRKDPSLFKLCETEVCFLIQSDPPSLILDPRMVAWNNQTPFRCKDRLVHFPNLGGSIFRVKDSIPALHNALCVYAGNSCTFNEIRKFVEEHSGPKSKYRFYTQGLQIPYTVSRYTKQTYAIMNVQIVLVEMRTKQQKGGNIFEMIASTFDLSAALCFIVSVLAILSCWVLIIFSINRRMTLSIFLQSVLGEHDDALQTSVELPEDDTDSRTQQDEIRLCGRLAMRLLKTAFTLVVFTFTVISGVVGTQWVFEKGPEPVSFGLDGPSSKDLSEFIIPGDSALGYVFGQRLGLEEKFDTDNSSVPYYFCENQVDCFQKLSDKRHPGKKLVISRSVAMDYIHRNNACTRFVISPTHKPLFTAHRVWIMSSNVPREMQASIDGSIWLLRLKGKLQIMQSGFTRGSMSGNCEEKQSQIEGRLLWQLVAAFVGPLLVIALLASRWAHMRRRTLRQLEEEPRLE